MRQRRPAWWLRLILLLLAALLAAACGGGIAPATPAAPAFRTRAVTPTTPPLPTRVAATTGVNVSPRATIRTYTDAQGRTITLFYGRAVGRQGDWGWAHIIGKHLKGEWLDGGPVTNFAVIGVTTPEAVQEIIGRTLREDQQPDSAARGRREYRLLVADGRYELLTVVGSDGAIITAYPDTPRASRR